MSNLYKSGTQDENITGKIAVASSVTAAPTPRFLMGVVALMAASQIMNQVDRAVVAVGAADIMRDLGLSPEEYGLLASAFYIFHAVTGIIVGLALAHRIRPLLLVTGMVAIWTVTQLPPILFPTFAALLISRILLGAAEAPCMPAAVAVTHELYPSDKRSVPTSIVWVGAMVGAFIAPPVLTVVMAQYGWRSGFALTAGLSFFLFLMLLIVNRKAARFPELPEEGIAQDIAGITKISYWKNPTIISLTLVGFCAYWMTAFSGSWLFPMAHLHWGYSQYAAGWVTSGVFLLCAIALLAFSAISQRMLGCGYSLGHGVMLPVAGCLLTGAACLALSAALPDGIIKLVLVAVGISLMPVVGASISVLISGIVPRSDRNRLLVVILALTSLAGLPAPYVTGWLINHFGAAGYDAALLCCGIVTGAGGLLALRLIRGEKLRPLR